MTILICKSSYKSITKKINTSIEKKGRPYHIIQMANTYFQKLILVNNQKYASMPIILSCIYVLIQAFSVGQGGLACCSPWSHKQSDTT